MSSQSKTLIHPTALIETGAELGVGVEVGPYCIIGAEAKIGDRTKLSSHVVVSGRTQIGSDNVFHSFCVVGGPPQDVSYAGDPTELRIGDHNVVRESCTFNRGTVKDRALTTVGNHNYLMAYCHVGHDSDVHNHVIMANQVQLAGHVRVDDYANIGGITGITQRARIGAYAFVGANSVIRRDLPPFMCAKEFSQVTGPNIVGLKRNGMSEDEVRVAMDIYKIVYLGNLTTDKAVAEIESQFLPKSLVAKMFVDFVKATKIGIQR
jgi:UDP-N-acetylglucosamine acyltransferase